MKTTTPVDHDHDDGSSGSSSNGDKNDVLLFKSHTQHGIMIDAGSTGSRLHVYEFEPRTVDPLDSLKVKKALDGSLLTLPTTHSQWTNRLQPGLATFATYEDSDDLHCALAKYLRPLLEFATNLLRTKQERFDEFPIYLRATAGMRLLKSDDRDRVMNAVRTVLSNDFRLSGLQCGDGDDDAVLNPFRFANNYASVLSGEEEAVYGWAGANYLMGSLLTTEDGVEGSQDTGNPNVVTTTTTTYGALDMGGASTQISFIHSSKDIMSNLFNFHLGGTQHWGVYTQSFLHFGINEAQDRVNARLVYEHTLMEESEEADDEENEDEEDWYQHAENELSHGNRINNNGNYDRRSLGGEEEDHAASPLVHSPCLPGGSRMTFTSNVKMKTELGANDDVDVLGSSQPPLPPPVVSPETATTTPATTAVTYTEQPYTVTLVNDEDRGNFDQCSGLAQTLLLPAESANGGEGGHHHDSSWCASNECSVSGHYQPSLPTKSYLEEHQQQHSVDFIAFSAYNYVWDFLHLPSKATMKQLQLRGRHICQMSLEELQFYNTHQFAKPLPFEHLVQMCFRAAYTFEILHHGYGFQMEDSITTIKTLKGQEMGWALGAMLYEINTLPWEYKTPSSTFSETTNAFESGAGTGASDNDNRILSKTDDASLLLSSPSPVTPQTSQNYYNDNNPSMATLTRFPTFMHHGLNPIQGVVGIAVLVLIVHLLRLTSKLKKHNQHLTHTVSSISLDLMMQQQQDGYESDARSSNYSVAKTSTNSVVVPGLKRLLTSPPSSCNSLASAASLATSSTISSTSSCASHLV